MRQSGKGTAGMATCGGEMLHAASDVVLGESASTAARRLTRRLVADRLHRGRADSSCRSGDDLPHPQRGTRCVVVGKARYRD